LRPPYYYASSKGEAVAAGKSIRISASAAAVLDAAFRSRVGCATSTEGGKEVPSMSEDKKKELETVDITGLTDEELDDVVGGAAPLADHT
jgi:hypothetical protein